MAILQIVPKLLDIINKQYSIQRAYEKHLETAKQMAFKQGTTPIEKHLMSSSISSFTDKVQNYYNFIKQQIKMQLDRFHATELLEQQN